MPKPLVIVESPAKAKTIARFLGDDYLVESSIGHIRDLPRSAAEVPAAYKGEGWARLGVDVDNGFKPLYVVSREKQEQVKKLRSLVGQSSEVYLATDEDREGESIAWHLLEVLAPQVPVRRMVFHEITRQAIEHAIEHPRDLDRRLVDAQEARRILDRLYGYELSPVLWKKVMQGLSAGRVQSVFTRVVVERERERMRFRSAAWWSLTGSFETEHAEAFEAELASLGGRKIAEGGDFTSAGQLADASAVVLLDEAGARSLGGALERASFAVVSVEEKPYRRSPAAPFITSTLQQEAARKLRFSAQRTMQVAQRLYEQGYITYMRTDSTTLSQTALNAARDQARELFGKDSVPSAPRTYDRRVKNAQEAHEAVRPAGERFRTPQQLASELRGDELRLYELVWQRTVASQMIDATGVTARLRISGETTADSPAAPAGTTAEFTASGTVITSPGFLRVYREDEDDVEEERREGDRRLPSLSGDDPLAVRAIEPEGHATKPPPRYTEASLVKRLEELGVGRPSTYASMLQTIQDRGYVWKRGSALVPSLTAFAVVGLLEEHFPALVDYGFTASMEDDLDDIAGGEEEAVPWLERFYFGADVPGRAREEAAAGAGSSPDGVPAGARRVGVDGVHGLKEAVSERLGEIDAREVNSIPIGADENGEVIVARVGRYGPYLQRGEDRASIPEDLPPDELTVERALELLNAPAGDRVLGDDPATGLPVLARAGRFGPYVQLGEAEAGGDKPRTASLFKSMSPDSLTLEQALELLRLPRTVGVDPATGEEVVARNGRYGPYVQRGSESRSLEAEEQLLTVSLEEALALLAQPKQRRFGRAAAAPAKEVGQDPETGQTILLREGRFGPYVTDGTVNASLRRGDDAASLTLERAAELLADKRAAGPAPARRGRAAKKAPAKKTVAKKAGAAKKAVAKKAGAAKSTAAAKKAGAAKKAPARKAVAKRAGAS
ncbi:MAG TPA: type I DNA topoisomerase [Acidimicrobiales bacterium]|nr:type I DNA topoisomerase [Acidimicrobiales bacterium]